MRTPTTIAFVGSGDASAELVQDELDVFMPEEGNFEVILPDKVSRKQKGLKEVIGWLTHAYGDDAFVTSAKILNELKADTDRPVLVLVDDESTISEDDMELGKAALDAGIPVKSLLAGMDDVEFEDDEEGSEEESTADNSGKSAKRPPAKSRTRTRGNSAKPAEEPTKPQRRTRGKPRTVAEDTPEVDTEALAEAAERALNTESSYSEMANRVLADKVSAEQDLKNQINAQIADALEAVAKHLRPKEAAPPQTFAYIKEEDGTFRKRGRGRPARGEEAVELTQAQIDEFIGKGLIDG